MTCDPHLREARPAPVVGYDNVALTRPALDMLISEATSYGPVETGGALCGYLEGATLIITHATPGGPRAIRERSHFVWDTAYVQQAIDLIAAGSRGRIEFVGSWHTHVRRSCDFSPQDAASLRHMESSPDYHIGQPLMIIVGMPDVTKPSNRAIVGFTCLSGSISEVDIATIDILKEPHE